MWPFSGAARNQLAQSHTMVATLEVLHGGRPVYTLAPTDGSVGAQVGRAVLRNLTATVADPTGELSGGDLTDLLSPYDCEVVAWRGVLATPGDLNSAEWAPLGVFGLTSKDVAGDGSVVLTGQDRAARYQGAMSGGLSISAGTSIEDAIAKLLTTRNSGLHMHTWVTGYTCGPLLYSPDIDVWAEAQKLASSVGGWLYHDRSGDLVFGPLLPTSTTLVTRLAEGEGRLLSAKRTENADSISNVIVMRSSDNRYQAVAEDTDPSSPTYARGRYLRRVKVITNEHIGSVAQAQQAATTELIRELGREETVVATVVADPSLDPLDTVVVHRPLAGLIERSLVIEEMEVPLTADAAMTLNFRGYILTRDGQTLDTDLVAIS